MNINEIKHNVRFDNDLNLFICLFPLSSFEYVVQTKDIVKDIFRKTNTL